MTDQPSEPSSPSRPRVARRRSDVPFFLVMSGLSSCFVLLIVLLLLADLMFTTPGEFIVAIRKPEIQAAFRLTIVL